MILSCRICQIILFNNISKVFFPVFISFLNFLCMISMLFYWDQTRLITFSISINAISSHIVLLIFGQRHLSIRVWVLLEFYVVVCTLTFKCYSQAGAEQLVVLFCLWLCFCALCLDRAASVAGNYTSTDWVGWAHQHRHGQGLGLVLHWNMTTPPASVVS